MSPKSMLLQWCLCLVLLWAILALESWTNMDLALQHVWFSHGDWLISAQDHKRWSWLFYTGPKRGLLVLGIFCVLAAGAGYLWPWAARGHSTLIPEKANTKWLWRALGDIRYPCLLLALALLCVPLFLGGAKKITNIYCPYQLDMFGGTHAYQRVLETVLPQNIGRDAGQCFPAGHASGGFALLMLFFCFSSSKKRWAGLACGLLFGWSMGLYQMFRGQHFLSHTLFSMVGAWLIIMMILFFLRVAKKRHRGVHPSFGHKDTLKNA